MSNETNPIDTFTYLHITKNPDGTLTRHPFLPEVPPTQDPSSTEVQVLTRDVPINSQHATWARIYIPRDALDHENPGKSQKMLPLVVFFHGGGFILFSPASSVSHDFCVDIAGQANAVVVSVKYRLAPEDRLPAAYDDAVEALQWIGGTRGDPWLTEHVDFGRCYVAGGSAGGNIAYHACRRVIGLSNLGKMKIQGLMLLVPFFGGVERSESELRMVNDPVLPLSANDLMWELSLPVGADRDHEYCNPTVQSGLKWIDQISTVGLKVLVLGFHGDPLIDRQIELARLMENRGVRVTSCFIEGGYHGLKAKIHIDSIKDFIN